MNRSVAALCFLALIVGNSIAFPMKDISGTSKKGLFSVEIKSQPKFGGVLCQLCVQQAIALVNILLNSALGEGVKTCNDLCAYVPAGIENELCDAVCDALGLYEFIRQLENDDIDVIYLCELVKGCPVDDCTGDCIDINSYVVKPAIAPLGSKVSNVVNGVIKQNWNGTGMLRLVVNFPGGSGDEFDNLLDGGIGPVGPLSFSIDLSTKAAKGSNDNWTPGEYTTTILICNGECGSSYPHSRIFAQASSKFKLSGN